MSSEHPEAKIGELPLDVFGEPDRPGEAPPPAPGQDTGAPPSVSPPPAGPPRPGVESPWSTSATVPATAGGAATAVPAAASAYDLPPRLRYLYDGLGYAALFGFIGLVFGGIVITRNIIAAAMISGLIYFFIMRKNRDRYHLWMQRMWAQLEE